MKLLLLGSTGLVGSRALNLALSNPSFTEVMAPTRKALAPSDKLINPIAARLEDLVPTLLSRRPDAVICALGTTQAKAGSKAAFHHVDYDLPLTIAKAAHAAGVPTYALVSAMGASQKSMSFYYRTKGEVERDIRSIGFRSLTICRPSLIEGPRSEARNAEGAAIGLLKLLGPILPKKLHVNSADKIAAALIDAVRVGKTGSRWIYAEEMI